MSTIRKIRWFWSWNDAAEEKWLSEMSAQGLHLKEVENPCFYLFEQGDPKNYVYKLDYYVNTPVFANIGWYAMAEKSPAVKSAETEYHQLFEDAGWQYLCTTSGWRYFRQPEVAGQVQELYTDLSSKETKYRRQIFFQVALILFVAVFALNPLRDGTPLTASWNVLGIVTVLIFAIPLLPLWFRLRQLGVQT